MKNIAKDILFGVAVGDALGVPVEFCTRSELAINPVTDMQEYGTHFQPCGTWSDDSSLTFCTAESLLGGYNLADMAERYCSWRENAYWTAHNEVFDIGITTKDSLIKLRKILNTNTAEKLEQLASNDDPTQNGNGSLMRILPLLLYIKGMEIEKQFETIWEVSALTHPHIRAALACFIYLRLAENLLEENEKLTAYNKAQSDFNNLMKIRTKIGNREAPHFSRIINHRIDLLPTDQIESSGYVVHTLEAAIWCFLTTNTYSECVLKAVNLGDDTDTTAAVAGGLAGIYYGHKSIPDAWMRVIYCRDKIETLAEYLTVKFRFPE